VVTSITVPASEFARNFGRYQDEAINAKVISVTSHGRVVGGYLSADELAHYENLKQRERKVLIVDELDDEAIKMIAEAEYGVIAE